MKNWFRFSITICSSAIAAAPLSCGHDFDFVGQKPSAGAAGESGSAQGVEQVGGASGTGGGGSGVGGGDVQTTCTDAVVEDVASAADENCDGRLGLHVWSTVHGDSSEQASSSMTTDSSGHVYVTGYFQGHINFGANADELTSRGDSDIFIAKLDAAGKHLWSQSFGAAAAVEVGNAVATDQNGDVVLVGAIAGTVDFGAKPALAPITGVPNLDVFIAKFDSSGNVVWSLRFGDDKGQVGVRQDALDVTTDKDLNILISGRFKGTLAFDPSAPLMARPDDTDLFVAKFTKDGKHVWSKAWGGNGVQSASTVTTDADGNALVAGTWQGFSNISGFSDITEAFVLELEQGSGNLVWKTSLGPSEHYLLQRSIAVNHQGDVLATTAFSGTADLGDGMRSARGNHDAMVVKLNNDGKPVWVKQWPAEGDQWGAALMLDSKGDIVVGARFTGSMDVGQGVHLAEQRHDAALLKLDQAGNLRWVRYLGGVADQRITGTAIGLLDNVFVTVTSDGPFSAGGALLPNQGNGDVALAQYLP